MLCNSSSLPPQLPGTGTGLAPRLLQHSEGIHAPKEAIMLSSLKSILAAGSVVGLILATGAVMANTGKEKAGAKEDIRESAEVLRELKQEEPELAQKLAEAKGVFIIPDYATASLLVGGSGGEGIMMDNREGQWGNPGFYDIGNLDIGAQAGAAVGSIVMLLMTDEAVENFRTDTDFSLTAEAGLTLVNWSADASALSEDGDVLVWSNTQGLLAEASVGVGGIRWDEEENREYYNREVTADQVLAGTVEDPHEDVLRSEFAEFTTEGAEYESTTEQSEHERY
jgi:lipid-binding SYLF domain-containing protein